MVPDAFLSCLCGSEAVTLHPADKVSFLSCLCGSEAATALSPCSLVFLSCLCGSEVGILTRKVLFFKEQK